MSDSMLDILKLVLLVLLYLFFARVLWAVWSEVRTPANARGATDYAPQPQPQLQPAPTDDQTRRQPRPGRGRGTLPGRLVVLEPKERKGTTYAINGSVGIGRDAGNQIQIGDDTYLSGRHARLWIEDGNVVLDDLDSRNGTFLNGIRVSETRIVRAGDRIQIGYTVFEAQ